MTEFNVTSYRNFAGRKPDVLCIGGQKCGTSWFHEVFGDRSDVWRPPFKELHFFDQTYLPDVRQWDDHIHSQVGAAHDRHLNETHNKPSPHYLSYLLRIQHPPLFTEEWYESIFSIASQDQICLDVTPEYSCLPDEGVEYIKSYLPDTKFIYFLRDPVERLKSQARMEVEHWEIPPRFKQDWEWLASQDKFRIHAAQADNIARWSNAFGKDKLLFLPYARIAKNPVSLLREVETFLGLKQWQYSRTDRVTMASAKLDIPDWFLDCFKVEIDATYAILRELFDDDFRANLSAGHQLG